MPIKSKKFTSNNNILKKSFFCRPSQIVAPQLIGCTLVKELKGEPNLYGVIVETEAYCQSEPGCHGHKKRTPKNETLFGEPGQLYVYLIYGIYYCVNIVTDKSNWASGVLLRGLAIPGEDERIAAGPSLTAKRFGINKKHDTLEISRDNGIWIEDRLSNFEMKKIIQTKRVGISKAKDLNWRWYLQNSRSISKRAKGDKLPKKQHAWQPKERISI
tara:strand:+ start:1540 stop:2184 length:645 start_codon:yes stop_codon:yes gene_type:complete